MRRQPFDQPLHLVDLLRLGGAVLLRPAVGLARDVILAAAEIAKPDRRRLERMQPRQRPVHRVIDRGALLRVRARHFRIPEHAAGDEAHHVERRAGDAFVGAIDHRLGDRKALRGEPLDHPEFAVHRMRRGQKLARRLSPQHIFARRRLQHIGRVRLPALELLHLSTARQSPSPRATDKPPAAPDRSATARPPPWSR